MRRRVSTLALLLAWLCANGALLDGVQVFAWAKMFRDYARVLPAAQALRLTFDGTKPCEICCLIHQAEETRREQLPRDAALGGGTEKLLLVSEAPAPIVIAAPASAWPAPADTAGLTRTDPVPVPPPRV